MQSILLNQTLCFNVFNIRTYDKMLCNFRKKKTETKQPEHTSDFDVSKRQKQLRSVLQINSDRSASFGLLPINVGVTVSHNVAFNSIIR